MVRLGVIPHLSARLPLFQGCLAPDWEFRDVITGLGDQARSCQCGEKTRQLQPAPSKVKANRIICSECLVLPKKGWGRNPPPHSVPAGESSIGSS